MAQNWTKICNLMGFSKKGSRNVIEIKQQKITSKNCAQEKLTVCCLIGISDVITSSYWDSTQWWLFLWTSLWFLLPCVWSSLEAKEMRKTTAHLILSAPSFIFIGISRITFHIFILLWSMKLWFPHVRSSLKKNLCVWGAALGDAFWCFKMEQG